MAQHPILKRKRTAMEAPLSSLHLIDEHQHAREKRKGYRLLTNARRVFGCRDQECRTHVNVRNDTRTPIVFPLTVTFSDLLANGFIW